MKNTYTTQEVADRLGVSRQRVLNMIYLRQLRAEKGGRDWLITQRDLNCLIELRRQKGIEVPDK